jgi:hypothetical protein
MHVTRLKVGLALLISFVLLLLATFFILYFSGLSDSILLHGLDLKNIRKEWLIEGSPKEPRLEGFTNSSKHIFVYTNTYTISDNVFESLFAMDASDFDGKGILIITKDGTLIWLDKKKGAEIVRLPQRYK